MANVLFFAAIVFKKRNCRFLIAVAHRLIGSGMPEATASALGLAEVFNGQ